ncbi:MAG: EAL domain-containing protein [Rhodocyclaceae bacterium]|nr:EAL domain-containing protein [Rhodocyclaceae bacterium]MBX3669520.1 EAL domain-containing protein [Rhodocyclaceae bacterium]
MDASLHARLLALALGPTAVLSVVMAAYFTDARIDELDQALREEGRTAARQVAQAAEYAVFAGNLDFLRRVADAAAQSQNVRVVTVFDRDNHELVRHAVAAAEASTEASGSRLQNLRFTAPIVLGQSLPLAQDMLTGEAPADVPGKVLGKVLVEVSQEATAARKRQLLVSGLSIALIALAVSGFAALRLARRVTRPILGLVTAVERMALGQLGVRVPEVSRGELQKLESGFNSMAGALESVHRDMQKKIDEATALLSHQARHDTLTGLVNRREFDVRLARCFASARQHGARHLLCFIDLDRFKIVNDSCGHAAGDELLRQVSSLLKGRLRDRDTLARVGGDEFAVLLENYADPINHGVDTAEAMRKAVEEYRFFWNGKQFSIGASIGVTAITADSESVAALLEQADAACYEAKSGGRNRVILYRGSAAAGKPAPLPGLPAQIEQALAQNTFQLCAQPIAALRDSIPSGWEIFVRLPGPGGGNLPADEVFVAAERYGLMPAVDRWVISHALANFGQLQSAGGARFCSINLGGASVAETGMAEFIAETIAAHDVDPALVYFELKEGAAGNLLTARAFMQTLKALGCRFMLDDFGAGVAAFTQLKQLPWDVVKIDASAMADLAPDSVDGQMLASLAGIARSLGMVSVAERVESRQVLECLPSLGVDYAQGEAVQPVLRFDQIAAA